MIKDNILSTKYEIDDFSPGQLSLGLAARVRLRRLELNLTQAALSGRSGVNLGTLKRFERQGEISLKHLCMLAVAMAMGHEIKQLFTSRNYADFDEAVSVKESRDRKRGRINA